MYKKSSFVVGLVATMVVGVGGSTYAALVSLPTPLVSKFDPAGLGFKLPESKAYSLPCIAQLAECPSDQPIQASMPVQPVQAATLVQPVQAAMLVRPVQAAMPVQPVQAAMPVQPVQAAMPVQPVQAAMPVQPVPPSSSIERSAPKKVAMFGFPKTLKQQLDQVPLNTPTLAPMAHTMFCLRYPEDCTVRKIAFRGGSYRMTPERWRDLRDVNARVNRGIRPERNLGGLDNEKWIINPKAGDCNDYAVSKQHQLLARGWPSRALLLAEVTTDWGEGHLILVVRTGEGDFVLDNLTGNIRPWSKAPYRWKRVQSPRNPKFWSKVRSVGA